MRGVDRQAWSADKPNQPFQATAKRKPRLNGIAVSPAADGRCTPGWGLVR